MKKTKKMKQTMRRAMKRGGTLLLMMLALPLCALSEQQEMQMPAAALHIGVTQTVSGACTLETPFAEPDGQAGLEGEKLAAAQALADEVNARLAQRLMTQEAERTSRRAGADVMQTAKVWQDGKTASIALTWAGTQADGLDGYSVLTMALDLTTGGEIGFDALFADPDGARAAMEAIIERDVLDAMSDYMEYADLLPMPTDSFSFDEEGLTVYWPQERYRYFSGEAGSVTFCWYELADFIGEGSAVYALSRPQQADAQAMAAAFEAGGFGDALAHGLGEPLAAFEDEGGLSDPDYTTNALVYPLGKRGWAVEIPKYAETDDEETPVSAIRASRISFFGLTTGRTTREEAIALLGEPAAAKAYDEEKASDMLLEPGESLFFSIGGRLLQAHFEEDGRLACLILRQGDAEGLY